MSVTGPAQGNTSGGDLIAVIEFDAIDSTNAEAMRRAVKGERGPLWLRADRQLQGRGRSGRVWASPSGNLSATLLFCPGCEVERLSQLSFVAGIAVFDAVAASFSSAGVSAPEGLRVKWPNDVMIAGAKLSGILIETTHMGGEIVAAVGCGVNISVMPDVTGRDVTRLADHGIDTTPSDVLGHLSRAFAHWLAVWQAGGNFSAIREAWLERAGPLGAPMTIHTGEGKTSGAFNGIDPAGALLLIDAAGSLRRFHYGDVTQPGANVAPTDRTE